MRTVVGRKIILGRYLLSSPARSYWAKTLMWDTATVSAVSLTVASSLSSHEWTLTVEKQRGATDHTRLLVYFWHTVGHDSHRDISRSSQWESPMATVAVTAIQQRLWVPGGWKWPHPTQTPPGSCVVCLLPDQPRCWRSGQVWEENNQFSRDKI